MPGLNSKSLMALGLKRPPRKIWTNGHYKFVQPIMLPDCRVIHVCEDRNGLKQWYEEVPPMTLAKMGLQFNKKTEQVEKLEKNGGK